MYMKSQYKIITTDGPHTLASRTDILETNETDETTHEDEKGDGTLYIEAAREMRKGWVEGRK